MEWRVVLLPPRPQVSSILKVFRITTLKACDYGSCSRAEVITDISGCSSPTPLVDGRCYVFHLLSASWIIIVADVVKAPTSGGGTGPALLLQVYTDTEKGQQHSITLSYSLSYIGQPKDRLRLHASLSKAVGVLRVISEDNSQSIDS